MTVRFFFLTACLNHGHQGNTDTMVCTVSVCIKEAGHFIACEEKRNNVAGASFSKS